jgi:hypothetical protein
METNSPSSTLARLVARTEQARLAREQRRTFTQRLKLVVGLGAPVGFLAWCFATAPEVPAYTPVPAAPVTSAPATSVPALPSAPQALRPAPEPAETERPTASEELDAEADEAYDRYMNPGAHCSGVLGRCF